jgi:EAL domain-containing protein (putative c-di-GMP-specific phosphodiesterase class I)/CheY-like chemotaxis protein
MQHRIRVLIAEDDPAVRQALSELLSGEDGIDLVATAGDADEAIEAARRTRPTVVLCDVRMPGGGGPRATAEIRSNAPRTNILALSAHDDRSTVIGMLQAGAVGYLVKGSPADDIVGAIRRAAKGESSLSARVTGEVIRELVGQLDLRDHEAELKRRRAALMRQVVEGGGITMVFQPIVDLRTLDIVGLEALARFGGRPARPPDKWFQEAGALGMRIDLELATARAALVGRMSMPDHVYLAVNVSPDTVLSADFPLFLSEEDVDGVVFEISEHAQVENYDGLGAVLADVRAGGGRLAIDDAGAGFASLQHILRLTPDLIKLDMGLTRDVDSDPARRALAAALASFADEIGAGLIAEGIETARELDTLRGLGVAYGQGFHLGKPAADPMAGFRRGRSARRQPTNGR